MFALPPLQFPPFMKGFTVRWWEKVFGCVYMRVYVPLLGLSQPHVVWGI